MSRILVLDKVKPTKFHYIILFSLMIGWGFDAMNSGLISFALPLIKKDMMLDNIITSFLLSAWLIGMLIGAIIQGMLSDLLGRKKVILISLLLYTLPTILCSLAYSWYTLFILRLLAGLGSSGYMVVASTLLSEYTPYKYRGAFTSILESAWAFGWLLASYIGLILGPNLGWRNIFLSSSISLIAIPIILVYVPESIRYLLNKKRFKEVEEISFKILGEKIEITNIKKSINSRIGLKTLFSKKYRKRTLMLWIHWFCIVLAYWGIFLWLPQILYSRGISLIKSLQYSFIITLAQIPGYWSGAYLIEKIGRKKLLIIYISMAGLGSLLFWTSKTYFEALIYGIVISFFNLGAWGATYAYTPELYPTSVRGTGSGWANGIGRIGGILGPIIVGVLATITGKYLYVFIVFALVHFISAISIALLGIETMGKTLEEISD